MTELEKAILRFMIGYNQYLFDVWDGGNEVGPWWYPQYQYPVTIFSLFQKHDILEVDGSAYVMESPRWGYRKGAPNGAIFIDFTNWTGEIEEFACKP